MVAFVFLVFKHGKLNEQLEYNKAKVIVYERYLKRYDDSWKEFEEDGSEYLTDEDNTGQGVYLRLRVKF